MFQQIRFRQRRGKLDARLAFAVIEIDGHDEFFTRDGLGGGEYRPAAIAELITRVRARAASRDAVGIRQP
jgi:hypothetical protein